MKVYSLNTEIPTTWSLSNWGKTLGVALNFETGREYVRNAVMERNFMFLDQEAIKEHNRLEQVDSVQPKYLEFQKQPLYNDYLKTVKHERDNTKPGSTQQKQDGSNRSQSEGISLHEEIRLVGRRRPTGKVTCYEGSILPT